MVGLVLRVEVVFVRISIGYGGVCIGSFVCRIVGIKLFGVKEVIICSRGVWAVG